MHLAKTWCCAGCVKRNSRIFDNGQAIRYAFCRIFQSSLVITCCANIARHLEVFDGEDSRLHDESAKCWLLEAVKPPASLSIEGVGINKV